MITKTESLAFHKVWSCVMAKLKANGSDAGGCASTTELIQSTCLKVEYICIWYNAWSLIEK